MGSQYTVCTLSSQITQCLKLSNAIPLLLAMLYSFKASTIKRIIFCQICADTRSLIIEIPNEYIVYIALLD